LIKTKAKTKETQSDTDSIVRPSSGPLKKHPNAGFSSARSKRNTNSRSDPQKDPYALYNKQPKNPKNPSNRLNSGPLTYSALTNPKPKNPKAGQGFFTERAISPNPADNPFHTKISNFKNNIDAAPEHPKITEPKNGQKTPDGAKLEGEI
jgi:hypothetical protein